MKPGAARFLKPVVRVAVCLYAEAQEAAAPCGDWAGEGVFCWQDFERALAEELALPDRLSRRFCEEVLDQLPYVELLGGNYWRLVQRKG